MPSKESTTLRRIIEEKLIDENELPNTALNYSLFSYETVPQYDQIDARAKIFSTARDMRIFVLRKVISRLYGTDIPSNMIECGSAGDISAALALPNTAVYAVDIDPDIWIGEINEIPKEWFDAMGMERRVVFYNDAKKQDLYKENRKIVSDCLPNYHRIEGDGERLCFCDESLDFALVQGTPDMLDYFKYELSRVLKPGKYLASIVYDDAHPQELPSFYETDTYASWPEYMRTIPEEDLPLEAIEIPEEYKRLETLCSWDSSGVMKSTGIVFEIFRKI